MKIFKKDRTVDSIVKEFIGDQLMSVYAELDSMKNDNDERTESVHDLIGCDPSITLWDALSNDQQNGYILSDMIDKAHDYILEDDDRTSICRRVRRLSERKCGKELILLVGAFTSLGSLDCIMHNIDVLTEYEIGKDKPTLTSLCVEVVTYTSLLCVSYWTLSKLIDVPLLASSLNWFSVLVTVLPIIYMVLSFIIERLMFHYKFKDFSICDITNMCNNAYHDNAIICRAISDANISHSEDYDKLLKIVTDSNKRCLDEFLETHPITKIINR